MRLNAWIPHEIFQLDIVLGKIVSRIGNDGLLGPQLRRLHIVLVIVVSMHDGRRDLELGASIPNQVEQPD